MASDILVIPPDRLALFTLQQMDKPEQHDTDCIIGEFCHFDLLIPSGNIIFKGTPVRLSTGELRVMATSQDGFMVLLKGFRVDSIKKPSGFIEDKNIKWMVRISIGQ